MSNEGRIVGFQPTSLVGVNHWSANPLAKELYGGKELSPGMCICYPSYLAALLISYLLSLITFIGLLEPGLKIQKPESVIVLELLMSLNQDKNFALARQMH